MRHTRRTVLRTLAGAGVIGTAGCTSLGDTVGTSGGEDLPPVGVETVAEGFTSPTQLVDDPMDDVSYVLDQVGTVYAVGPDGLEDEPYLDYRDRVLVSSERGLLGMAFHPDYPDDTRLFLRYSAPRRDGTPSDYSHTEVLVELEAPPEADTPRTETERTLIEFPSPTIYHQAGTILFGPDDYLYVAMGEGTVGRFAQNVETNLLGGIHRIDVDGSTGDRPYGIPDDNPLVGTEGRDEYFAWGFRNPWRMSFNDGDLVVGDVGSFRWEEIDVVEKGHNYGWPYREGPDCMGWKDSETSGPRCGVDRETIPGGEFVDPVVAFPNSRDEDVPQDKIAGTAVIAGYVYGRDDLGELRDRYLFSNYTLDLAEPAASLFAARRDRGEDGQWPVSKLSVANSPDGELNRVVNSMGRDAEGRIYLLTVGVPDDQNRFEEGAGELLRVVPPEATDEKLSPP